MNLNNLQLNLKTCVFFLDIKFENIRLVSIFLPIHKDSTRAKLVFPLLELSCFHFTIVFSLLVSTIGSHLNQTKTRITLPYIHTTSEMVARHLRPFNIDVAHKPTCKLRSNFTKHKDKTHITEKRHAIYIFPCKNCPDKYIGKTSKKIRTRLTEHQNTINRQDHSSLPAKHTDDNGHKFDWSQLTRCLGQATTVKLSRSSRYHCNNSEKKEIYMSNICYLYIYKTCKTQ